MSKPTLLLIDDDIESKLMNYYRTAFQEYGFEITTCDSVDEARKHLEGDSTFDLVSIDLMMPPGEWFREEDTDSGLLTGLFLAQKAKELKPQSKIFFLTNLGNRKILEDLNKSGPVYMKIDWPPRLLAEDIQNLLKDTISNENN